MVLNLQEKDNELNAKDKTIATLKRQLVLKDDIIKSLMIELDKCKSVLGQDAPSSDVTRTDTRENIIME